jgi:hypothetical protein
MRNTILIAVISLLFFGCKKDTVTTKPTLTYKSANTTELFPDQLIEFKLSFTDKEGDLQDTMFIIQTGAKATNGGTCVRRDLKLQYLFPQVPGSSMTSGDIKVSFANGVNIPGYQSLSIAPRCSSQDDTCIFRFVLRDKAKNTSDTVNSETIIIYR